MGLDLRHVESFVAVAEARSFSVAAARLNTVQSAVSSHIRLLETQMKRRLVARGRGKPVSLTAEGTAFLTQARRLLALADEITQSSVEAQKAQVLRLGTTVTFALSVVPRALKRLPFSPTELSVSVRTARSQDLLGLLDTKEIDVALVFDQGDAVKRVATSTAPLVWAGVEEAVSLANGTLTLGFLNDARDLRRHAFSALEGQRDLSIQLDTQPDAVGLRANLLAGRCLTVLPKPTLAAPLVDLGSRLPLPEMGSVPISVYVSTRGRDSLKTALCSALSETLQSDPE